MAGDDVPAELIADLERAFEIDARAPLPAANRGHPQRLGGGIDGKPGAVALLSARDHGQAHAAAGDRGADVDRLRIIATGDLETGEPLRARLDRNHLANVGHDAGKHLTSARISPPCPPPWLPGRRRGAWATELMRKAAARRGRRPRPAGWPPASGTAPPRRPGQRAGRRRREWVRFRP